MIKLFEKNVYDYSNLGIGVLSDTESCEIKNGLNDEFSLELKYPTTGHLYSEIKKDRIIVTNVNLVDGPQPFRIKSISTPIRGSVTVTAYHLVYDLVDYLVPAIEEQDFITNALNTLGVILDSCGSVIGIEKQPKIDESGYIFGNFEFDVSEINKDQQGTFVYDGVVNASAGVDVRDRSGKILSNVIAHLQVNTHVQSQTSSDDESLTEIFKTSEKIQFTNPDDPTEVLEGWVPKGSISPINPDEYEEGFALLQLDKPSNLKTLIGTYINEQDKWKTNRQTFKSFIESFSCDVKFSYKESNNKVFIKFVPKLGRTTSIEFRYGVNLKEMKCTENTDSMYTHIYPYYGSGEDIITLDSEGKYETPLVEITTKNNNGDYISMENILGRRRVYPLDLSSEFYDNTGEKNEPSSDEIYGRTIYYIDMNRDTLTSPELSLEVQYAQLSKSKEYETFADFDKINLGDYITVIYPDLDIKVLARVKSISFDPILMQYKSINIGDRPKKLSRMFLVNDLKENDNRKNNLITNELGIIRTNIIYYLDTSKESEIPNPPVKSDGKPDWITDATGDPDKWTTICPQVPANLGPYIPEDQPRVINATGSNFKIDPMHFIFDDWETAVLSTPKANFIKRDGNTWKFEDDTSAVDFITPFLNRNFFSGTPVNTDCIVTTILGAGIKYYTCRQYQRIDGRYINTSVFLMEELNNSVKNTVSYSENIHYLVKNSSQPPSKPTSWVENSAPSSGDYSGAWYRNVPPYVKSTIPNTYSTYYVAVQTRYLDGTIEFTMPIADYSLNRAYSDLDETVVASQSIYFFTTQKPPVIQSYPTSWTDEETEINKWGMTIPDFTKLSQTEIENLTMYQSVQNLHKNGNVTYKPSSVSSAIPVSDPVEYAKSIIKANQMASNSIIAEQTIYYSQSTQYEDIAPDLPVDSSGNPVWVTSTGYSNWINYVPTPTPNTRVWMANQVKKAAVDSSGNNIVETSDATRASMDNLIISWLLQKDQVYIDGRRLYAGSVTAARTHVIIPNPIVGGDPITLFDANGLENQTTPYVKIGNYIVDTTTGGLVGEWDADSTQGIVIRKLLSGNSYQYTSLTPGYITLQYGSNGTTMRGPTSSDGSGSLVSSNGFDIDVNYNKMINFKNGGLRAYGVTGKNRNIIYDEVPSSAGPEGQIIFVKAT